MAITMPERYRYHMPMDELERRWRLVRAEMAKQEIDCLIINAYDNMLGGYLRWFSDIPMSDYPGTVLFHREDDMTYIGHGGPSARSVPAEIARGIGETPCVPVLPTLHYTNRYVPDVIIENVRRRGYKKIGFVALATIPATIYKYVTEELKGVEIVDATDLVDHIKAVKSPEEIKYLRKAADLHDRIFAALPAIFRTDRYEYEIVAEIRRMCADMSAECVTNVSINAHPQRPAKTVQTSMYRRTQPGDKIFCLIEVSGPGGYFCESMRTIILGEPTPEYIHAAETAKKSLELVASMMKPGASCPELFKANNDFLAAHGYNREDRYFAHGQGCDMVERPAFVPSETMVLAENMFIAVHPGACNEKAIGLSCSNFLITKDGCEQVTTTPNGLIVCQI